MALTKKNIIVGAAKVYIGPSTSATASLPTSKPAFVAGTRYSTTLAAADGSTSGTGTAVTDWREVGYTQDGVTVATAPSWGEVAVDQLLDSAKIFKDGMSLTIGTTFAEATLENLVIAWGQAASTSLSSVGVNEKELAIEGGNLGESPLERGLIAVGNAPENVGSNTYGERVYQAYRVLSVDNASHTLARADATVLPVSFRALPADNGRYGSVRDRLNVT